MPTILLGRSDVVLVLGPLGLGVDLGGSGPLGVATLAAGDRCWTFDAAGGLLALVLPAILLLAVALSSALDPFWMRSLVVNRARAAW